MKWGYNELRVQFILSCVKGWSSAWGVGNATLCAHLPSYASTKFIITQAFTECKSKFSIFQYIFPQLPYAQGAAWLSKIQNQKIPTGSRGSPCSPLGFCYSLGSVRILLLSYLFRPPSEPRCLAEFAAVLKM